MKFQYPWPKYSQMRNLKGKMGNSQPLNDPKNMTIIDIYEMYLNLLKLGFRALKTVLWERKQVVEKCSQLSQASQEERKIPLLVHPSLMHKTVSPTEMPRVPIIEWLVLKNLLFRMFQQQHIREILVEMRSILFYFHTVVQISLYYHY